MPINNTDDGIYGDVIDIYSRAQAVLDGEQILIDDRDLAKVVIEVGYKYPMYVTRSVWSIIASSIASSNNARSYAGILYDILWMSRNNITGRRSDGVRFTVKIEGVNILGDTDYRNFTNKIPRNVFELALVCAATDFDNPAPCLTLMLPSEV